MRAYWTKAFPSRKAFRALVVVAAGLGLGAPTFAQAPGSSPWENAVNVLQLAFTSTIARGLSLVAIVVSGLTFPRPFENDSLDLEGELRLPRRDLIREEPKFGE